MRMLPLVVVFVLLTGGIGYALAAEGRPAPVQSLRGAVVPPLVP
ncbi:hypothetical protein [Methylobacterium iners]|uniref:Uncharacterized protein n=1 Tax=Methylobacterium iners TaxID=418707 RepID=A0ABQ4S4S6_9HYPH|nr:hypothetical protein [Methylobacterium iners]GJD97570.1 hypothetical protein OCOJLMKI_4802 [Methylobacterium iners]